MANQYSGSFEHKMQARFNCTAEEVLKKFASEDLTYYDAEEKTGISQNTIRKWSKRLGVDLLSGEPPKVDEEKERLFTANEMNMVNFLSRPWNYA
jgi:hypothetical protein